MSNYTPVTIFRAKDSLPSGNSAKIIKGSEFSSEFEAIQTAISTKADTAAPTFTGASTFQGNVSITNNGSFAVGAGVFVDGTNSRLGLGSASASERLEIHSGNVLLRDNVNLKIGTGGDLLAYHDGTNSYVEASNSSDSVVFNAKNNGTSGSYIKFVNDDTASNLSDGVNVGVFEKSFITGVNTPFIRAGKDNQPDDLNSLDVFITDSASFTRIMTGTGTPEGNVTSNVGSIWLRTDGGSGTTLYVKESGTNSNTGWVAK